MTTTTLKKIRRFLGQNQRDFAANLGVSLKSLQSYEQGWRRIPGPVEKKILYYLCLLNRKHRRPVEECWRIRKCAGEARDNCLAWKMRAGHECWFISDHIPGRANPKRWKEKRLVCLSCDAFRQHLGFMKGTPLYRAILDGIPAAASGACPMKRAPAREGGDKT